MDNQQKQNLPLLSPKLLLAGLPNNLRPEYRRRLEIMLRTNMGQSQAEICAAVGCSPETARYWMAMAKTGQTDQWNRFPIGRPKTVNEMYLERLQELVINSPTDYGYSFKRWTGQWLSKHLAKELDIEISPRHINRLLKQMGLSTRGRRKPVQTESVIKIGELQPSS